MTRVISFASGKGGVGKTSLAVNLGVLWAKRGKEVLLVDGDWSLGKLSIALGVKPHCTVEQVLQGSVTLEKAVYPVSSGLSLLAAPSGVLGFETLTEAQRNQLYFDLDQMNGEYDVVLFDHASGVDRNVLQFAAGAHQHVIVATTEPTSYMDAYAIMKLLSKRFGVREFWLVVTMCSGEEESKRSIRSFVDFVRDQLLVRLHVLETLPWDPRFSESIRRQKPYVSVYPDSALSRQLLRACRLLEVSVSERSHGLQFFYRQNINDLRTG